MMNKGRSLVTSLVRKASRGGHPPPPRRFRTDMYGRPSRVLGAIESMQKLDDSEKIKYGYLFSELLGLPKPPEISTNQGGEENKFAVKLVNFVDYQGGRVLREVALAKWNEQVRSMKDFEFKTWVDLVVNVPSVVKQGLTKKQAQKLIAKIEAAGGEAVMVTEPLE